MQIEATELKFKYSRDDVQESDTCDSMTPSYLTGAQSRYVLVRLVLSVQQSDTDSFNSVKSNYNGLVSNSDETFEIGIRKTDEWCMS